MPEPYRRILSFLREQPFVIVPSYLDMIVEVVELRAAGVRRDAEEIQVAIHDGRSKSTHQAASAGNGVAVIPVFGAMVHRMNTINDISAGVSTERVEAALRAAAADDSVASILMDFDSPGGAAAGVSELWSSIREAGQAKPVIASANGMLASGALWAASAAHEIVATPSAQIGSVGAITCHENRSGAAAKSGVRRTYITSKHATYKAEGNPYEPLADEAAGHVQQLLDQIEATFHAQLAEGRGTTVEDVIENYGSGRMFLAEQALERGMVDRIETMHQTLSRMVASASEPRQQPQRIAASRETIHLTAATAAVNDAAKENEMSKTAEETAAALAVKEQEVDALLVRLKAATEGAEASATSAKATFASVAQRDAEARADRDLEALKDRVNLAMRASVRPVLILAALAGDSLKVKVGDADVTQYEALIASLKANPPILARGMDAELASDIASGDNWTDQRTATGRAYDAKFGLTPEQSQAADLRLRALRAQRAPQENVN